MIVLCAATSWECGPIARRLKLEASGKERHAGYHAGRAVTLLRTGVGSIRTKEALVRLGNPPQGFIAVSAGLAGALQPGIQCGDLVADLREAPVEFVEAARESAKRIGMPFHPGIFLSVDGVMNAETKRTEGAAKRAVAVDMESEAVRSWCSAHGGTFLALRAVLDEVDREVPPGDYDEDASSALAYAFSHWRELPTMMGLYFRQRHAMRRLCDFYEAFFSEVLSASATEKVS